MTTQPTDEPTPGDNIAATFANQFYVFTDGAVTRLAFGEIVGTRTIYHTALVIPTGTAKEFADLLQRIIEESEQG